MHTKERKEKRWQENAESKKKKVLFAVEIIVLLVFIGGLYVYGQTEYQTGQDSAASIG